MLTPDDLLRIATALLARCPDCTLARNGVGNLAITQKRFRLGYGTNEQYIGFVDLGTGDVTFFDRD